YYVIQLHIALYSARWVYDLPGEFCRFLRFQICSGTFFKKSQKRRRSAGSKGYRRISSSGKGENHPIPQQKGGENDGSYPSRLWTRPVRCLLQKSVEERGTGLSAEYEASKRS